MKTTITAAALCLLSTAALAQNSTATGTGVGVSESNSAAGAVAVNRGNGGNVTINSSVPANTTATVRQEGTTTVKNVPLVSSPGLAASAVESCLGSVSGGGAIAGFGASFGTTVPDPDCTARLSARTLWSMGLRGAAVAVLCARENFYIAMPDVCAKYAPRAAPAGYIAPNYGYPARSLVADANSGPIEVVNGKTGKTQMCLLYDEPALKCRQWAGGPKRTATGRPIVMTAKPPAPTAKPAELAVIVP